MDFDWMMLVQALMLVAFIAFIFPRAKHAIKYAPKGSSSDWVGVAGLLGLVALFIAVLTQLV